MKYLFILYPENVLNFYNSSAIQARPRTNSLTVEFTYRFSLNGLEKPYITSLTKLQVS